MSEFWTPLKHKDFEIIYEISNLGRVRRLGLTKRGHERKISVGGKDKDGYIRIILRTFGKITSVAMHILLADTFISNTENKPFINHKNGIKDDNRIENLEWCTQSENTQHAFDTGLAVSLKGEERTDSKLTNEQVLEIFNSDLPQTELSNKYNIGRTEISNIKTGFAWKHITGKKYERKRLLDKKVLDIFNGIGKYADIATQFNVGIHVVATIKRGETFGHITGIKKAS